MGGGRPAGHLVVRALARQGGGVDNWQWLSRAQGSLVWRQLTLPLSTLTPTAALSEKITEMTSITWLGLDWSHSCLHM